MRRAALLACMAALAYGAAPAQARFVSLPAPPGAALSDFAAARDAWVAIDGSFPLQAYVSRDGAASWQPVPLGGVTSPDVSGGLSVGPDGAVYLSAREQNGWALLRLARGAAGFERLPAVLPSGFGFYVGAPAWDAKGRPWIGIGENRKLTVSRLADDGSLHDSASTTTNTLATPVLTFGGGKLYADMNSGVWQLAAGVLRQISGQGTTSFGNNFPVAVSGRTILTESGLSVDDGASFANRVTGRVLPVQGNTRLLVEAGFSGDDGGRVLTRWSPEVYRPSGLTIPSGTGSLWQTSRGLLAVGEGSDALSLHVGKVPAYPLSSRGLSRIARSMLARANHYRRQAGLPPFAGDRLIAKASLNHARYWSGRALPRGNLLDVHGETPGARGFTGRSPQDRCRHAGGDCGGEVMNFGNQARSPVDSWMATPYHRSAFTDPASISAGAARVGRIAVMNFSFSPRNLVIKPVLFPVGRYRGTLMFPGNEAPDPLAACRAVHQPLGRAPSVPVTFVPPATVVKTPVVELFRGRARVPGCTKAGFFMGRVPLRPRTRYTAKATWYPDSNKAQKTTWTFTTG